MSEVPTWKQLGYPSADALSCKIEHEGGFDSFFFGYGITVVNGQGSEFNAALDKMYEARAEVMEMLSKDGVDVDDFW